jgi:serine/threonine protein kinase
VNTIVTAPAGGCLDVDELVAMSEGSLASDRVDVVISHIDGCADCAEVVAGLGGFERSAREVGRYRLEKVLGAGGMGIVHAAWDPELRRRVAVKLVHPHSADGAARARMLREARALARINHPNVVAVHDVGEHGDGVYVATELVDGETLATWCARRPPAEIVGAWVQVARGLAAAHAEGVIHRDVKPSNALVSRDGRVRIGDFGLARRASAADSIDGRARGLAIGSRDPVDSSPVGSGGDREADTALGAASTEIAVATPAEPEAPRRAAAASSPRASDDSLDIGSQVTDIGSASGRRPTWRPSSDPGRSTLAPISSRSAWRWPRR